MTLTNFEKNNQTLEGTTTQKVDFLTKNLKSTYKRYANIKNYDFDEKREKHKRYLIAKIIDFYEKKMYFLARFRSRTRGVVKTHFFHIFFTCFVI